MKKKGLFTLALLAGAAWAPAAGAQTRGGFEIGLDAFDYSYRERLAGETIVRDDGKFVGITLGYTETLSGGWFLRGKLSGAAGSVDYRSKGGIFDEPGGPESRLDDISQGVGHFELTIGRDFRVEEGTTITPFVGLATRVLNDESGDEETDTGLLGYDREVSYHYVPLGLAWRQSVGRGATIILSGQYNWVLDGKAESKLSDIDPELPDVKVDLNGGSGLEFSAIGEVPLGRDAVRFGPYIRHWNIDESDSFLIVNPDDPSEALELHEPRNRTTELGFRVSFAF